MLFIMDSNSVELGGEDGKQRVRRISPEKNSIYELPIKDDWRKDEHIKR